MTSSSPATPSFFRSWRMSVTASTCWVSLSLAFLWISQLSHYVYWTWIWHSLTQSCLFVDQSIITLCVLKLNLTLTHSILPFCGSVNYDTMCSETDSLSLAFLCISQLWHYVLKLNLTLTDSVSDHHRNKHLTLAKVPSKLIWSFRLSVYYPTSQAHRFYCRISADQRKKKKQQLLLQESYIMWEI